jgi:uncharacterized protein
MPVMPFSQKSKFSFDASRLRLFSQGNKTLVMDRISGKWLSIDTDDQPFVKLLGSNLESFETAIPESIKNRVEEFRNTCITNQVGIPGSERSFGDLNTLIVKLTNACNLACTYCYDFEKIESAQKLEQSIARRAIDQALDICPDTLTVLLHGGEPMLMWETVEALVLQGEMLAYQKGKQILFSGQSNMTRLNERIVAFSEEHEIAWGISLDGTAAIHNHFRIDHQGQGSYGLFINSLEKFPRFLKRCGVMSTITQVNDSLLLETARHFRDMGMASWNWSLFQPIGRGREQSTHFEFDIEKLLKSWNELFDALEEGEFDGFPVMPVKKYLDNFISGPSGNMCMRPQCGAARDLLSISADGTIEACDCIDPTGPLSNLGNLETGTLAEARASATAETIRSRNVDTKEAGCGDCLWYGVCGGTCLAHSPSLNEVWIESCEVAKLAFSRISQSLLHSQQLPRYLKSLSN